MSIKLVFISLPMSGLDDEAIMDNIRSAKEEYLTRMNSDIRNTAFIHNFHRYETDPEYYNTPALKYLGRAIDNIGQADEVFFYGNWKEARGCQIEHKVCELYGIPIVEV